MKEGIFIFVVISLSFFIVWFVDYNKNINEKIQSERNVVPKGETKKIIEKQMKKKSVGDCILYKTSYGYKCIDKNGKCYKIHNKPSKVLKKGLI